MHQPDRIRGLGSRAPAPRRSVLAGLFVLVLASVLAAAPASSEVTETFTFDDDALEVFNLIGSVTVVGHSGSEFEVTAHVRGADARAGAVRFERDDSGRTSRLAVVFPDGEDRYVYPEMEGSRTTFQMDDGRGDSWLREILQAILGDRITVTRRGRGTELWVDLEVGVPNAARLGAENKVGRIVARDVTADLRLDTGSGGVEVAGVDGQVEIDTGSGRVDVSRVSGDLSVDTGSGSVKVADVDGRTVMVDTGSGSVEAKSVRSEELEIDTGSGRVVAERIATERATVDTGSGSVTLLLDAMGDGDFEIDTGSGSITLGLPVSASAEVEADTGSGGVEVDLEGVQMLRRERDHLRFQIGAGGARIRLDTGSGSIRITESD